MYEKGQVDLEGNGTLVEVNTMSAGAFLQPPEGLSRGPVPAEPVFKSHKNHGGIVKTTEGWSKPSWGNENQPVGLVEMLSHIEVDILFLHLRHQGVDYDSARRSCISTWRGGAEPNQPPPPIRPSPFLNIGAITPLGAAPAGFASSAQGVIIAPQK